MQQTDLPEEYRLIRTIDLQKDKKTALLVNIGALAVAAVMILLALIFVPFTGLISPEQPMYYLLCKSLVLLAAIVLYLFLHEWTHGIFMKQYSGVKPKYGFTGLYAYAGSTALFDKKEYRIIGLSPIILLGLLLLLCNVLVPYDWFWVIYILQVINISGAVGDLYVTFLLHKLPEDLLVRDSGVAMEIFTKEQPEFQSFLKV